MFTDRHRVHGLLSVSSGNLIGWLISIRFNIKIIFLGIGITNIRISRIIPWLYSNGNGTKLSQKLIYVLHIYPVCLLFHCNYITYSDLLPVMDGLCSGRRSCEIEIRDLMTLTNPCPDEVRSYLQAKYTCLPGESERSKLNVYYEFMMMITYIVSFPLSVHFCTNMSLISSH